MSTAAQAPKAVRLNAATTLTVGPSKNAPGHIDLTIQRGLFSATERLEMAAAINLSLTLASVVETVARQ